MKIMIDYWVAKIATLRSTAVYHPQANPVERNNRDLKPRLVILVQEKHDCWSEKLAFIRFALNTAKCETT
ncbi:hypothetical protein TNCV_2924171 [Trichonephila clavipes]|nr:hypothetical protein TNCV_2924171 [Trichonephila clavipes]